MTLGAIVREERRAAVLRILAEQRGDKVSVMVLQRALEEVGLRGSFAAILEDARWLRDRELAAFDVNDDVGLVMLGIRARGEDAAAGRIRIEGLALPPAAS